ncbi:MAG TPA: rhodanese-like domain-containing protein [Arenimonas sp.]|nr:rhodanese-like domain-containing protein [Arenimonas sp.]
MRSSLLVTTLMIASASTPAFAGRPSLSPGALDEVRSKAHAPLILDVRSEEEFRAGHIPGARNIPHDQLNRRLAEIGDPKWVVVYCRSGRRAGIAEKIIDRSGVEVRQLEGSWLSWDSAGLPKHTDPHGSH